MRSPSQKRIPGNDNNYTHHNRRKIAHSKMKVGNSKLKKSLE